MIYVQSRIDMISGATLVCGPKQTKRPRPVNEHYRRTDTIMTVCRAVVIRTF